MNVRLPNLTHRTMVIGKTGSGKTQFSAWLLSKQRFDKQPFVIIDYKGDQLLNSIHGLRELDYTSNLPKEPGLYIIRPLPNEDEQVESWLWKVWDREKIGLYFDEGTLIPGNSAGARGGAFAAILQQGRSKHIPSIVVSQRPAGILRSCFSEADFFAIFYLNTAPDIKRISEMLPIGAAKGLKQDYYCAWYDVGKDQLIRFSPVPNADMIREKIEERIKSAAPRRHFL